MAPKASERTALEKHHSPYARTIMQ